MKATNFLETICELVANNFCCNLIEIDKYINTDVIGIEKISDASKQRMICFKGSVKMSNKRRPITDPWGTPQVRGAQSDASSSNIKTQERSEWEEFFLITGPVWLQPLHRGINIQTVFLTWQQPNEHLNNINFVVFCCPVHARIIICALFRSWCLFHKTLWRRLGL